MRAGAGDEQRLSGRGGAEISVGAVDTRGFVIAGTGDEQRLSGRGDVEIPAGEGDTRGFVIAGVGDEQRVSGGGDVRLKKSSWAGGGDISEDELRETVGPKSRFLGVWSEWVNPPKRGIYFEARRRALACSCSLCLYQ